MDKIKEIFKAAIQKMDGMDPAIKFAVLAFVAMVVISLLVGIFQLIKKPDNPAYYMPPAQQNPAAVVPQATAPQPAPQVIYPAGPGPSSPAPVAAPATQSGILSPAAFKLDAAMVPGKLKLSYRYVNKNVGFGVSGSELSLAEMAEVGALENSTGTFQFIGQPDKQVGNQIAAGSDTQIGTTASAYFKVDSQSTPVINLRVDSNVGYKIEVYIDDHPTPAASAVKDSWGSKPGPTTLAIQEPLAAGFHKLSVVVMSNYRKASDKTAVRVAFKGASDSMPSDMAIFGEPVAAPVASPVPVAGVQK